MLALVLVAVSVGLGNLAASIGIGVGGVSVATRLRVVLAFGLLEAGMPIVGLLIGHDLAASISREAKWIAALLLAGVGCYGVIKAVLARRAPGLVTTGGVTASLGASADPAHPAAPDPGRPSGRQEWIKLTASGFALSLDNLIAGFALGSYQVSLVAGALVFGFVSIALSLAGLEFGARLGNRAGDSGELIGGVVLIGVGMAVGFGLLG